MAKPSRSKGQSTQPIPQSMEATQAISEVQAAQSTITDLGGKVLCVPGYEILGELGRGGMGVVYKARDQNLKRVVALKMVLAAARARPEQLARFRAEAEAVARLQHPHIVQIYAFGEHAGQPYFVLEFVEGGSLDRRLKGHAQPPHQAAHLVLLLAGALHAAHGRGIVHRDLKPANVLLAPPADVVGLNTAYGCPKVADFGLVKLIDVNTPTVEGTILGTPSYMAPEQAEGNLQLIGPATDIYALGVILYEMLTGTPPFRGDSVVNTLYRVCHQAPAPPRTLCPGLPAGLEAVCLKCLEKTPQNRYPTAMALAADLEPFLSAKGERTVTFEPAARPSRRAKPLKRESGEATLPLSAPSAAPGSRTARSRAPRGWIWRMRWWAGAAAALTFLGVLVALGFLLRSRPYPVPVPADLPVDNRPETVAKPRSAAPNIPPAKLASDPDREAARWVLAHRGNGQLSVLVTGAPGETSINKVEDLPDKPFRLGLVQLNAPGGYPLTDSDLAVFRGTGVRMLYLQAGGVTDSGLAHLAGLDNLKGLHLAEARGVTDAGLKHLRGLTGLTLLWLQGTRVTGTGLEDLRSLARLENLILMHSPITDAGLEPLRHFSRLSSVDLSSTRVTSAGLAHLTHVQGLQGLRLSYTAVGDQGLSHLASLTALNDLCLDGTLVTDEGLAHLAPLTSLQTLFLTGTNVKGSALARLSSRKLTSLALGSTKVGDAELAHLRGMVSLQQLMLGATPITDASVETLQTLTGLKTLTLEGTAVTEEGLRKLKQALPNCNIMKPK